VEFGFAYLISRLGGGYLFGMRIEANADEKTMPLQALAGYRTIFGPEATPELVVYDRGAGVQRARPDRGDHWDFEKRQVQIQQAEGTSVADAGDGRAEVYLVVQSAQVDARYRGSAELNRRTIESDGGWKTGQSQEESRRREIPEPSREFCDTL
jgi:hypothetical protein